MRREPRVRRESLILCPECDRHRKPSEFTLVEPGPRWTRVKCIHCGKIFGIFGVEFRPAKRIVDEEIPIIESGD
ncbi:hypothetical protein ES706_02389 [subsurface metagenome]